MPSGIDTAREDKSLIWCVMGFTLYSATISDCHVALLFAVHAALNRLKASMIDCDSVGASVNSAGSSKLLPEDLSRVEMNGLMDMLLNRLRRYNPQT